MQKLKPSDLRKSTLPDLEKKYTETKTILLHTRQKQINGNATPNEIYLSKRNVACILTILREKKMEEIVKQAKLLKKKLPKKLERKTRRERLRLSDKQLKVCRNGKSKLFKKRKLVYAYMPSA